MSATIIGYRQQAGRIRRIKEADAMNASADLHTDETAVWVMKKRLQLNSLLEQEQIDELASQLAGYENSILQRVVMERWIDAQACDWLAAILVGEKQAFGARIASKIADRLRDANGGLELVRAEAIGLAASYPRHRSKVEDLFLATPAVLYSIAVAFGDENDVPFEPVEQS